MISDYQANALLDAVLRNVAYSLPATVYMGLFTTAIYRQDAVGTPTEVSGGSYARTAVTFGAAAHGRTYNSSAVTFPSPTADWGPASTPVIFWAILDASTNGHFLYFDELCCGGMIVLNGDDAPSFPVHFVEIGFE